MYPRSHSWLLIKKALPPLPLPLPQALLRVTHLQRLHEIFFVHSEQGKFSLGALGGGLRVGRARSWSAIVAFTIFRPPHVFSVPLSSCSSLLNI